MTMTTSRIDVDGQTFLVNQSGAGNEHAVLWLHGSGPGVTSASNWEATLNALAGEFHNIAPDMLGFGESTHPDPPPLGGDFLNARADTMIALMDEMGVAKFDLVGNSMGCAVGAQMAMLIPDRIGRLVFMGGAAGPPAPTPGLKRIAGFGDDPTVENLATILESFVYAPEQWGDELQRVAEIRVPLATQPDVMRSHAATFDPAGPKPRMVDFGALPQPALVVHGADDQVLFLESGVALFEKLSDARLHVFGQCGHWVQIEKAEEFRTVVRGFLTEGR